MDISKKYTELWGSWPVRMTGSMLAQGTRPVWGRIVGASLTRDELARRTAEMPLRNAELGVAVVRQAIETSDEGLRHLGEAMVAKALADASDRPDIMTQAAVTEVAASLPLREVVGNPYVDPSVAARVAGVLGAAHGLDGG